MWVMTSWGILMPGLRPAGTVEPGDVRTLQVRARRKSDLQILRDRHMPDTLGPIIRLPHTDYEYRAYCTPNAWGDALAEIGRDIDYVKFKETAETRFGDKVLHDLYMRIWGSIFSALASPTHRAEEYRRTLRPVTSRARRRNWWDDASDPGLRRRVDDDIAPEVDDEEVTAFTESLARDGLHVDGDVIRGENGMIDHSFCAHSGGRKARRRCERRHSIIT